jgi:hypothetical protein
LNIFQFPAITGRRIVISNILLAHQIAHPYLFVTAQIKFVILSGAPVVLIGAQRRIYFDLAVNPAAGADSMPI